MLVNNRKKRCES